jgi:5-formyltetrahydrofolate cyclo-ligase
MGPRDIDQAAEQALRARAKAELRQRMRSVRRMLPQASCDARSAALCARLRELPEFARATTLVGYSAFGKEANPEAALLAAAERSARLGLVRVAEEGMLSVHRYLAGDSLEQNELGMLEPSAQAPRIEHAEIELILVPALAVAASGHRLGYGRGYYDRLLSLLPRAFKVAIAYDFQLLAEMPHTAGDVPVDCIVTDARCLIVERG